jgi:superfamily II DNA or RNA helicase
MPTAVAPALFTLRPYQEDAIRAVLDEFNSGIQRTAVVLPTGMGKTVIFCTQIRELALSGSRVLVLVHRDELVSQTVAKLAGIAPELTVGVVKATRDEWADVNVAVASVQTLGRDSRLNRVPDDQFGYIVVDECHHAAADSYVKIMTGFGCFDPERGTRAVGYTATLDRADGRPLAAVWQSVAYQKDLKYGIFNGYLVDVRGVQITVDGLDLASVARTAGDLQSGSLGDALESSGAVAVIADAYKEHATGPDGQVLPGIVFWPTVAVTRHGAEEFVKRGITCEAITGETPAEDRRAIYDRVRAGVTKVIANCMVLTEGFDLPLMQVAVIARMTTSQPLYVQMVGRVLRPWPGKSGALVLDVTGTSSRLSLCCLPNLAEIPEIKEGETLREALERLEKESNDQPAQRKKLSGKVAAHQVDLFHSSRSAWLKTPGGVWFIPTKSGLFFLQPDVREDASPDTWMVGKTHSQYRRLGPAAFKHHMAKGQHPGVTLKPDSWGWLYLGLPIEYAMAAAEQLADSLDGSVSSRSASWRKPSQKPSTPQVEYCASRGLMIEPTMSRSDVSNMIATHHAAKLLDSK